MGRDKNPFLLNENSNTNHYPSLRKMNPTDHVLKLIEQLTRLAEKYWQYCIIGSVIAVIFVIWVVIK